MENLTVHQDEKGFALVEDRLWFSIRNSMVYSADADAIIFPFVRDNVRGVPQ
jgi:hypothetical protein